MFSVYKEVMELTEKELNEANKIHEKFHSEHEGYSVILEELEEAEEELNLCKDYLKYLWDNLRKGESAEYFASTLKIAAANMACEAIQVAAMAQKYIDSCEEK